MCSDIAVLLLVRGCSGAGRFAWRRSWATPALDRFRSLVSATAGPRGGGPVVQVRVDLQWFRRPDTRITSRESFICHFAGQALLALI
jgi:hypothetical protein